jgi:hypothetical protein
VSDALSRFDRVQIALGRVYDCLDHFGGLSGKEAAFLRSLARQLHTGLPPDNTQSTWLNRLWRRFRND